MTPEEIVEFRERNVGRTGLTGLNIYGKEIPDTLMLSPTTMAFLATSDSVMIFDMMGKKPDVVVIGKSDLEKISAMFEKKT